MSDDLCILTAVEAVALLRSGQVSSRELVDSALRRIEQVDLELNALPTVCAERALDRAGREVFDAWFDEAVAGTAAQAEFGFVTVARESDRPVGSSRFLALRPADRGLEIGWSLVSPAAWGTGANTEAKLLMLEHAFERLGCARVEFKTDARNDRARAALAALPSTFEGVFRKHMLMFGGRWRDSAWYSITDDEWPRVREQLSERLAAQLTAA